MTIWVPNIEASDGPIYQAIADAIESDIKAGVLAVGDRLPPQRELAYQLGVTLGTVTRAYTEAERRRLLRGETGRGTFVAPDGPPISPLLPTENETESLDLARNFAYPHLNPNLASGLLRLSRTPGIERLNGFVPSEGLRSHRETGALLFSFYGLQADPDRVALTCGAQHGIQILLQALFRPGDIVAVDAFTYPSILHSAPNLGLKLLPIASSGGGSESPGAMDAAALASACRSQSIKGAFLMPNMQNPTTHTMSLKERQALVDVAREFDLKLIEDDPYTPFVSERTAAFGELAPERTASIASISKVISPGSRIGFVHVPDRYSGDVRNLIGESTWMASPITAELISGWVRDGALEKTVAAKKRANAARFQLVQECIGETCVYGAPDKVFVWLKVPEGVDPDILEAGLNAQGVRILAARHFQAQPQASAPFMRLTLGSISSDQAFQEAVSRVSRMFGRYRQETPRRDPVG
ncbi:transcriptional regulator, GntR family/aminotransferase, classes I and II family protein [Roseibium sp. TrichSKD4]|uniref:aminotransferase-like domain-containing protein n=1 Tax=Roseibium sp. TrichSKD4 TaxID=744980 RepID=UPI0001E56DE6|nr:PLP-dependent aminotransferase family protein [Roseibium sp. TrichSKD4]EFO32155.1 transcriptional regulator, GntR family/aminotransferase, classes I and II family protein [Roseibium sp. TrichSKD4]